MAKIKKKTKLTTDIPNASMSDIAFLLLIFFMVSTVFVKEQIPKNLVMPKVGRDILERGKIPRKHAATIYLDDHGVIRIDDYPIEYTPLGFELIRDMIGKKRRMDANLIISFRADEATPYSMVDDIMLQLRKVEALRIFFEARLNQID
ncbi:MAG: biopolymer transporter ExbD [Candidatus Cloacimonetes bacterium]|nr:biopolymer transporter ExbD [Candidatus Cloacimonadota bacterium]